MPIDRSPVLVGVAQQNQRVDDPREAAEPLELMLRAVRAAASDAKCSALPACADAVYVIRGVWRYRNAPGAIAERIGAPGAHTISTPYGGNMVQSCVNHAAAAIARGDCEVAVLAGAEWGRTQAQARRLGLDLVYTETRGRFDRLLAPNVPMNHPAEQARGIVHPVELYPMFESALRHARGESVGAHLVRISKLWEGFSFAAGSNPHAWLRDPVSAEQIRTPSASNRWIGFPYTKLMCANSSVDQAAALILCSVEAARRAGVPRDRFVFVHAGTDACDHFAVSHRENLHSSPAIRIAGARVLELAETEIGAIEHVDVYSCFPSAVQVAARELGLSETRPLTVTGGLTFAGGPLNNYVMHAIATLAEILREDAGSKGLITANGGFLTKHAFGVYSSEPPQAGFRSENLQEQVDLLPRREAVTDHAGPASLEAYTVLHQRDAPRVGHGACLLPDGRRTWASTRDLALLEAMMREDLCGMPVELEAGGVLHAA